MDQFAFLVNSKNCVGCKACEMACKTRNELNSPGPRLRVVVESEKGMFPDTKVEHMSTSCMHCADPSCAKVCPAGAIQKMSDDGTVVVDRNKCIGCHYCLVACPFSVPTYRDEDGTMIKCDGCRDRRQMGLDPACVSTCFYGALYGGPITEMRELGAKLAAKPVGGETNPSSLVVE